jgi:hypothetical protein
MTMTETYAVACRSVLGVSGLAGFGADLGNGGSMSRAFGLTAPVHGTGVFAPAADARAQKAIKAAAMAPARPWESMPPRETPRL